jgi:superoxide dismutase, Cu-Zn family
MTKKCIKIMILNSNLKLLRDLSELSQYYFSDEDCHITFQDNNYQIKRQINSRYFIEDFLKYSPDYLLVLKSDNNTNSLIESSNISFLKEINFNVINFSYDENNGITQILDKLEFPENKNTVIKNINSSIYFKDDVKSTDLSNLQIKINDIITDVTINEIAYTDNIYQGDLIKANIVLSNPIEMSYNLGFKLYNKLNQEVGYGICHKDVVKFPIFAFSKISPQGKNCNGKVDTKNNCKGRVILAQTDKDTVLINYNVKNLFPPGLHGFHIHEKADFSNGCLSAGPHFNPYNNTHGSSVSENRHVGDLGNIRSNDKGIAKGTKVLKKSGIKLYGEPEFSVIGRSMMVHEGEDDLGLGGNEESLKTGNAGARLACGEIIG